MPSRRENSKTLPSRAGRHGGCDGGLLREGEGARASLSGGAPVDLRPSRTHGDTDGAVGQCEYDRRKRENEWKRKKVTTRERKREREFKFARANKAAI